MKELIQCNSVKIRGKRPLTKMKTSGLGGQKAGKPGSWEAGRLRG